jgi:galactose mutarotase-like enzyme
MAFTYEIITRDGHTLDVITDNATNGLRITVMRLGAELVGIERRNAKGEWVGFLFRDGDVTKAAAGWNNHCTLMGYYIHRIKDERTNYRGHEIRGSTHSFLRHKLFAAPTVDMPGSSSLTYRIEPDEIAKEEYPYSVALALTYSLNNGTLKVTFHFENREPDLSAHVSFGLHPGFAGTSLESAEVIMPPGKYIHHIAPGNLLSGETQEINFPGGPMPFEKSELPGSFLLELKQVDLPLFTFRDRESGREVMLNYSGAPYVTLWSNGQAFICIEPCWGLPDHHEQRPFELKLGMQQIAPGGTLTRSFTIAPEFHIHTSNQ